MAAYFKRVLNYSSVAQLVEQTTVNRWVAGSSPARGATFFGAVAQLVRASACHAEGREFESRQPRETFFIKKSFPDEAVGEDGLDKIKDILKNKLKRV